VKIIVKAKTKARENKVERISQPTLLSIGQTELVIYKVSVKEAPVAGKANEAIIRALAEYFNTSISRITLVSGQTSKQKVFEIK
jgi:uncharacterized protein YggU (UPF0235/DUF167 family)